MSTSLWKYRRTRNGRRTWACGLLYNECALWVGVHYSPSNQRYCVNVLPFFTFWYSAEGGREP